MIDPSLPFIDLHRHLDGSVRLHNILELGLEHNLPPPPAAPPPKSISCRRML